jgi:hypothetical protein
MSGRALRWVGGIVVVLLILFVVADRVGVAIAEHVAADNLKSSQHLDSRPDVEIAGFPFLTQLATGHYDKVTVTAHDVAVGQQAHLLVISRLRVVLRKLTVSRDFDRVHADTATATGSVGLAELGKTLGVQLSFAGDGRLRASKRVTVGGTSVLATVTTRPEFANGALAFASTTVANAGSLGAVVSAALQRVFDLRIPLQDIRFDVRVQRLAVDPDGVTLALIGQDLVYST